MNTSAYALMWDYPHLGKRIGIATIQGYTETGIYKKEEIPIYEKGEIYITGYNSFNVTTLTMSSTVTFSGRKSL